MSVRPADAAVVGGGTVEFDAVVADDGGAALDGAQVVWSSDAPDVVFVDAKGVARALSDGVATIEASFRGVTGSATVVVLRGPSIELSPVAVFMLGGAGGKTLPSQSVRIDNGGYGSLTRLVAEVPYELGEPTGWLTARLATTTSPTTLTLTSDIQHVAAAEATAHPSRLTFTRSNWSTPRTVIVMGVDDVVVDGDQTILASVSVDADSGTVYAAVEDQRVEITVLDDDVAGFELTESGSGTWAWEGGGPDTFSVMLTARPLSDVVFIVSGALETDAIVSPGRLTLTPLGWNVPQPVSFTAIDDRARDGTRHWTVTISVDPAASDEAFHGLSKTVAAVTFDDDWFRR